MCEKDLPTQSRMALAICTMVLFATHICAASEKTLHAFGAGLDGAFPNASLVWDADGNLYGTTTNGGSLNRGTVFELTPNGSGGWTEKILHNFGSGLDGASPLNSTLIWDANGNLYGTTSAGGTHSDAGTVFEMTPNGTGGWTEKVLHNFGSGNDGTQPESGLIWDKAGNLYGTTEYGGTGTSCATFGCGTVYELTPNGDRGWTERVLHNLGVGLDGQFPKAGLTFDAAGNLYGTTWKGGVYSVGMVFEMTPNGSGGWTERALHNFGLTKNDGQYPKAGLIFDAAGNLYGTAGEGGSHDFSGTVFELTPDGSGGWTEKILHNFGSGLDGAGPESGLIFDGNGNLYGTTVGGGSVSLGAAFEMTPNGSGGWTEFLLHNFGVGTDGYSPQQGLVFDNAGNLYGSASEGGTYGQGTVYEITPD
jgi:uncharacterized repeat protein (TIGR03803 family)